MRQDGRNVTARFTLNAPYFLRANPEPGSVYARMVSLSIALQLARRHGKRDIEYIRRSEASGVGVNVNP